LKTAATLKEKASDIFKTGDYKAAVAAFDECLNLDALNLSYNAIINLNKSIALHKLKENELSLKCLDRSI